MSVGVNIQVYSLNKRGKKKRSPRRLIKHGFFPFMFTKHEWKFMGSFEVLEGEGGKFPRMLIKKILNILVVFKILNVLVMLTT